MLRHLILWIVMRTYQPIQRKLSTGIFNPRPPGMFHWDSLAVGFEFVL